jgi:hypothetical protein
MHNEMELIKLNMTHCKDSSKGRMEGVIKDFQESNLAIKECLLNMQKSSLMFIEGNQKFVDMTRQLVESKKTQKLQTRWLCYLSVSVVALFVMLVSVSVLNGHSSTMLEVLTAILKIK